MQDQAGATRREAVRNDLSGIEHDLRPLNAHNPDELNFVRKSWMREMRKAVWTRHIPGNVYLPCQRELIAELLRQSNTTLACNPRDPWHLYGCIVWEPGACVHWLYVAGDFRRMGVARALLHAAWGDRRPIVCSQATEVFNDRALVERYELLYFPYILLGFPIELTETAPCPPQPQEAPPSPPLSQLP